MATAWPDNLYPQELEWRLVKAGSQFRSPFTGTLQAIDYVGERWEVMIGLRGEGKLRKFSAQLDATLAYFAGGVNQMDIFHWVRPVPRGTLRGSPTLQTTTAKGNTQVVLTVAAGSTLEAGDLIGIGTQVFMARSACAAVSTTLTVPLVNRVRGVINSGTAVVWDRPKLTVVCPEMSGGLAYRPGMTLPAQIQLVEA